MKRLILNGAARLALPLGLAMIMACGIVLLFDRIAIPQASGQSPYPGPTSTTDPGPYPGATPLPTTTGGPTATAPTGIPYPGITVTVTEVYSGTPTILPMPTLTLLFPGDLPQTGTPASPTPARSSAVLTTQPDRWEPPVSLLLATIVVLWGLLGIFLVVYLRRLGYR